MLSWLSAPILNRFDLNLFAFSYKLHYCTEWLRRIQHRKWRGRKLQPNRPRPGQLLGSSLVSLRFQCRILRSHPVHPIQSALQWKERPSGGRRRLFISTFSHFLHCSCEMAVIIALTGFMTDRHKVRGVTFQIDFSAHARSVSQCLVRGAGGNFGFIVAMLQSRDGRGPSFLLSFAPICEVAYGYAAGRFRAMRRKP